MSSSTPSKSISTHLGTVYAGTGRNSGVPEQARDNETGEPLLIIHTTEAKLREAEAKILGTSLGATTADVCQECRLIGRHRHSEPQ